MSLLQVSDLTVRYPGRLPAVDRASLSIKVGEIVGLSGPSGCGKTTLALALMGLLAPDVVVSGSIRFSDRELRDLRDGDLDSIRGAEMGIVFQESALALNPLLTVGAQIADVVLAHERCGRKAARERARVAMADVGFCVDGTRIFDACPHELSGGQRQRVLIAQAIICEPRLVVADEPVASLDDGVRADVLRLIRALNERRGISFLLITHSTAVLATTTDRVIEMEAGRVHGDGARPATRRHSVAPARLERNASVPRPVLVDISSLTRTYTQRRALARTAHHIQALKGVDLRIERGSTLGLAGRSGCGKSTLARCVAGLERADTGQIRIDGTDIRSFRGRALLSYRNSIQLVFQDSAAALNPRFTAREIVSEALVIQGVGTAVERRQRSAELMDQVGLSPDSLESRTGQFSGGERQRLAIARALALNPRLLILDEAFSGLDVATRERIVQLLADLQARHGLTYVCISHDLDLLADFASDIAIMHDGRIVTRGPAHEVLRATATTSTNRSPQLTPSGAVA